MTNNRRNEGKRKVGFLTRLARDKGGNTLAIVGAALVPLTAMIGSGVDMSRAYMARARLQSACDAAALAGRRVMVGDTMSAAVSQEAIRYFNFNFAQGTYNTEAFTPVVSRASVGTVRVQATTNIPTAIMRIFGINGIPLTVDCQASLNFVNTDVMLVLDVTGSMADTLSGTQKIVAMRDAVMTLYDTLAPIQTQLEAAGLRLRYGVVPYSSTVNVGHLIRGVNQGYIRDEVNYETIVAEYTTPFDVPTVLPPEPPVEQIFNSGAFISQGDCDKFGRNVNFTNFTASPDRGGGPSPAPTWSRAFSNNEAQGVDWGYDGATQNNGSRRRCRRRYVETDTTYERDFTFTRYSFEEENITTTGLNSGGTVRLASATNGRMPNSGRYDLRELAEQGIDVSTRNSRVWTGCIEERDTLNTITTASGLTIPTEAFDLQLNQIPFNDSTRWRPMWPELVYRRSAGTQARTGNDRWFGDSTACPAEARRLAVTSRTAMNNYVNGLLPTGSTYHDIGMIWGARMLSTGGIFADGCDTFNGMPCTRHIIFMTDGQMDTDNGIYTFHGVERNSQRVSGQSSPSEDDLNNRHMQRFQMACNAARAQNASLWVIAFGTTVSTQMQNCASNANQVSTASNRQQLIDRFAQIGQNIGALRLTQ